MLITILVILNIIFWFGTFGWYFKKEIFAYLDNRFGPAHRAPKMPKPRRKGMYE